MSSVSLIAAEVAAWSEPAGSSPRPARSAAGVPLGSASPVGSSPSTTHQERRMTETATSCGVSRLAARTGRKASMTRCAARSAERPGPGSWMPWRASLTTSSSSGSASQAAAEPRTSRASSAQSSAYEWISSCKPAAPPSFSLQLCAPNPSGAGVAPPLPKSDGKVIAGPLRPRSKAFSVSSPAFFFGATLASSSPPVLVSPRQAATEPSRRPTSARPPPAKVSRARGRPSASGPKTSAVQAPVSAASQRLAEFSLRRWAYCRKPCCACRKAAWSAARAPFSPPCSRPWRQHARSRGRCRATYSAPPTPRRPVVRPANAPTAELPEWALSSTAACGMQRASDPSEKPAPQSAARSASGQTHSAQSLPSSWNATEYVTGMPGSSGAVSAVALSASGSSCFLWTKRSSGAARLPLAPPLAPAASSGHGEMKPKPLALLNQRTRPRSRTGCCGCSAVAGAWPSFPRPACTLMLMKLPGAAVSSMKRPPVGTWK
mmetsp:Transcript_136734/g.381076  ORF Transcript_136734/g.381076 Transcript_136734/m.381076 type:complete len:490 (-) Transcript_136734:1089-2558(-)